MRVASASATMPAITSATVGSSSMEPTTCPVGRMPASTRPSTTPALVIIGAFAARAICAHVRSCALRMARPLVTRSLIGVPDNRANLNALSAALGKRAIDGAFSSSSIISVRITRCGAPSIAVVTTVPVTGVPT